jgi:hypothetical protein
MVTRWLDLPPDFAREFYGRSPSSSAGGAERARELASWTTVGRLVGKPGAQALAARNGRSRDGAPRNPEDAASLFSDGYGLLLRNAERHDEALAIMAASFSSSLGADAQVNLHAIPKDFSGLGWQAPAEDVFFIQIEGSGNYFFRPHTADRIELETSFLCLCALAPGDWLYLPRGWWRKLQAREDSLSIELALAPPLGVAHAV